MCKKNSWYDWCFACGLTVAIVLVTVGVFVLINHMDNKMVAAQTAERQAREAANAKFLASGNYVDVKALYVDQGFLGVLVESASGERKLIWFRLSSNYTAPFLPLAGERWNVKQVDGKIHFVSKQSK